MPHTKSSELTDITKIIALAHVRYKNFLNFQLNCFYTSNKATVIKKLFMIYKQQLSYVCHLVFTIINIQFVKENRLQNTWMLELVTLGTTMGFKNKNKFGHFGRLIGSLQLQRSNRGRPSQKQMP